MRVCLVRFLFAFLLVSLCLSSPVLAATAKPVAPKTALPDTQVEEAIRKNFAGSKISVDHFTVRVKNGVATIEGNTSIIQRKGWATRYAKLGGARSVVNNIKVSEEARAKAKAKLAAARERRKAAGIQTAIQKRRNEPKKAVVAKQTSPVKTPEVASATPAHVPPPIRRAAIKH